jgi:hypothetical protein
MSKPLVEPAITRADIDSILRMNAELLSELWILRDRVMVLEKLLEEKGVVARKAIDDYAPDQKFDDELLKERDQLVKRVIGAAEDRELKLESLTAQR